MINKTELTNKFNEIFNSNKTYEQLSDIEKIYALVVLASNTTTIPTTAISGSKNINTANTFEVLTSSNSLSAGIYVQAKTSNTGLVRVRYLGTTDGVVIEKGQSLFFTIDNSNKLEVAVSVNNEGYNYWGS